jgi:hypothetical protein
MGYPPQFCFLGHGGNGVPDLLNHLLQFIRRQSQPSGPGSNLGRISQVDFVADRRTFLDALHEGVPRLKRQRQATSFVPFDVFARSM